MSGLPWEAKRKHLLKWSRATMFCLHTWNRLKSTYCLPVQILKQFCFSRPTPFKCRGCSWAVEAQRVRKREGSTPSQLPSMPLCTGWKGKAGSWWWHHGHRQSWCTQPSQLGVMRGNGREHLSEETLLEPRTLCRETWVFLWRARWGLAGPCWAKANKLLLASCWSVYT